MPAPLGLRSNIALLSLLLLTAFLFVSCGGSLNSASNSPAPPAASTPPPGGGGSGGSSGGSGSGSGGGTPPAPTAPSGPDTYLAQLFQVAERVAISEGHLTLNTAANDGAGNLQFERASTNTSNLVLQFCPSKDLKNCFTIIPSLATDANGNANVNFTFPQKGTFSGVFMIMLNGDQWGYAATGNSGKNFQSALLPASSVTGGINQTTGAAQGSGSVVVNDTTAHLVLNQTTPNHTFNAEICAISCQSLAKITTDAQGNATADIPSIQPGGGSVFRLSDETGVQFVSAFRVQ